jgi:hypothetical protein
VIALKPDLEATTERMEAFWARDVLDRPLVMATVEKPADARVPLPARHHPDAAARWLDAGYQADLALAVLSNRFYPGDSLPVATPNLGPEVFSALYGCPIHFGDHGTSWTDPILHDWADAERLLLDWDHPYLRALDAMTDALLESGRDTFITGMADWHPGGDALAALRDPERLALDLVDDRESVKRLLDRVEADWFRVYDRFFHQLRAAGQPITSWLPLFSEGRYYIPSNDFSIMIGPEMYNDVFLPGIAQECRFLDRSIYHLDGPGALRHLDSILSIGELDAVQWVPGAGNAGFARWIPVYQRIQAAGKGMVVYCELAEVPLVLSSLRPHGVCLDVRDVPDLDTAENLLSAAERWARRMRS